MSGFNKLSDEFEQAGKENPRPKNGASPGADTAAMIRQSKAIIKAIDKLKSQGIPVTKKAELDYLLALRFLEKHNVPVEIEEESAPVIKRNPKDNPKEFEVALTYSRKTVAEIEELLKQGADVPGKKLEEYELCKKFLKKFT